MLISINILVVCFYFFFFKSNFKLDGKTSILIGNIWKEHMEHNDIRFLQ